MSDLGEAQVPHFLVHAGYDKMELTAVTHPRRVAMMSVAERAAQDMDVTLGDEVISFGSKM